MTRWRPTSSCERATQSAAEAAPATLALAELMIRSKQKNREESARVLFDEVATDFPASAEAPIALVRRRRPGGARPDPAWIRRWERPCRLELQTYRTVVEQYPRPRRPRRSRTRSWRNCTRTSSATSRPPRPGSRWPPTSRGTGGTGGGAPRSCTARDSRTPNGHERPMPACPPGRRAIQTRRSGSARTTNHERRPPERTNQRRQGWDKIRSLPPVWS